VTSIQPRLVGLGVAIFLIGCVIFAFLVLGPDGLGPTPVGADIPAERAEADASGPWLGWPVVGGLCVALGMALVGVGMHRWRQARPRQ